MGWAAAVTAPSEPKADGGLLPADIPALTAATAAPPRSRASDTGSDSSETVTGSADIGRAIRRERLEQSITQAELARRVGVSRQWVVRLEQGAGGQGVHNVLRALAVVGLELYTTMPERPG